MSRLLTLSALLLVTPLFAADDEGVLPVDANGKTLNFDFETGTLKDWTAEGQAFKEQPVKGDTVFPRRNDMKSEHQGEYWIGTYERAGDQPQGTLTSEAFKVTHPWGSFLIAGGSHAETCIELVRKDTNKVFFKASGFDTENLRRVAVDLKDLEGKEIYIRVVDKHSGGWGHINFDNFRFHKEKPKAAEIPTQTGPDVYQFEGQEPEKAAKSMTVPEGFSVKLFAGEPDVQQPIAMCMDDRGRLWVAEAYSYPIRRNQKEAKDRILIFEDTDGDGKFDKRTTFMDNLNLVSGLEVGFGGVWIGAAPYLMFVPMKEGEDKPAGEPKILLDGWAYQDTHETLNSFIWGPDGWLYGCHGVFTHSLVGKPGSPDKDRQPINAGIWRYHPTKHLFEVFAHGTSNPWGFDFNEMGQAFCEACVIPHNWHIIQGGRYFRQAGSHFNPYTFDDIKTIAEHRHYVGPNPHGGNNRSDTVGGGHAHSGTMIYLGGKWPKEYRNQMFMGNIHGHRINVDVLTPKGSGYKATRSPDFLLTHDRWALLINIQSGPDGNAYFIDWYDKQTCHRVEPQIWDRTNGRIYKICYGNGKATPVNLTKLDNLELVKLQLHENDWYVRHARRLLQERAAEYLKKTSLRETNESWAKQCEALRKIAFENEDETRRVRGLWAMHVTCGFEDSDIQKAFADKSPYVRGWMVQLLLDSNHKWDDLEATMVSLANKDTSSVVRLYLASALQRIPQEKRWKLAEALIVHGEDNSDHNLPLMYWYGIEPLGATNPTKALTLTSKSKVATLLPFMIRRIGSSGNGQSIQLLVSSLNETDDANVQLTFLRGIIEGLKGRRTVEMPKGWDTAFTKLSQSTNKEVRNLAISLSVTFGDQKSFAEMRKVLNSKEADLASRQNALTVLVGARDKQLAPTLQQLISDPALRGAALRGLALYDDPRTPEAILAAYPSFNTQDKRDALSTLASRTIYAKTLLDAIAEKKVATTEVSADIVRQLRNLKDNDLDTLLAKVWGTVRDTPADRLKMMTQVRKMLQASTSAKPDLSLGRAMFVKTCAQCHILYGTGGNIGPDITGSNRPNLDYLLENILDPSAVIPNDYKMHVLRHVDGRTITGIIQGANNGRLTVVTTTEKLIIPKEDIESQKPSDTSMMPDDLLKPLNDHEIRSLFAYLQNPNQVPLLATPENAKDFFNGKDLTNWDGDPKWWSVENGEIVGKTTTGLKRNNFLRSHFTAENFKLTVKVKLTPNKENSGIQFRSEPLPEGEMRGYQADIGAGWWGKLYEEHGRELLWKESGEKHLKVEDWNEYVIEANGSKIKTYLNGNLCVDLDDPKGAKRGIFAFQIHSGGPMEVRFKDLKLEVNPK